MSTTHPHPEFQPRRKWPVEDSRNEGVALWHPHISWLDSQPRSRRATICRLLDLGMWLDGRGITLDDMELLGAAVAEICRRRDAATDQQ